MEKRYASKCILLGTGKKNDLLYMVQPYHEIIIIDVSRSTTEINYIYEIIEYLKNGVFTSMKYVPKKIIMK